MRPLLASELYATSQGHSCSGKEECHWCSAPCGRLDPHDDGLPTLAQYRPRTLAKRPGNAYVCRGCWLWRRQRTTVFFLSKGFRDGRCAMDHSWWITGEEAWAVRAPEDARALYEHLLEPPLLFCLALADGERNHLQQAVVNDLDEVRADTPLRFTLNGIVHEYTVYELEDALRSNDPAGRRPGVGALMRLFGGHALPPRDERKKPGRPRQDYEADNPHKKVIKS